MTFLKTVKWHAFLKGLMLIAVGVVAILIPDTMMETLGYLMGGILIGIGLISTISYLFRDPLQNYYHDDFVYGLLEIMVGVLILFHVDVIIKLVPVLLGVLVLFSGFSKLQDVIDMKRLRYDSWIFMLILALINMGAGALLIMNPFEIAEMFFKILGGGLIFSGITDSISVLFFASKFKKIRKEQQMLETNATEVSDTDSQEGQKTGLEGLMDELADNDSEGEDL